MVVFSSEKVSANINFCGRATWKTQLFHEVEPTQEMRWQDVCGEKKPIFEMSIEKKESVL